MILLVFCLAVFGQSVSTQTGLRGPSKVSFNDDNGTLVTLDFSDVEFFPVNGFNPFYSPKETLDTPFDPLPPPTDMKEHTVVLYLIDSFKLDSVEEEKPRVVFNAKYLVPLRERYPASELSHYYVTFNGVKTARDRKFNNYQIERSTGLFRERKLLASVNVQRRIQLGRKVIRFAFLQSYNHGALRTIWLTDDAIWKKPPLKHIGQVHTLQGWAMMWIDP